MMKRSLRNITQRVRATHMPASRGARAGAKESSSRVSGRDFWRVRRVGRVTEGRRRGPTVLAKGARRGVGLAFCEPATAAEFLFAKRPRVCALCPLLLRRAWEKGRGAAQIVQAT